MDRGSASRTGTGGVDEVLADLNPDLNVDLEEIRSRYRHERDKRLRPDGEQQYLETAGRFEHYATDDPHAPTKAEREPLTDEVEVVVVGGGFSGMLAAARLIEVGIRDVRIVEAGADFGGTWYWNRYPGAQCDIESYCYLPLLEETGYMPREKYSYAPEIFEHSRRIGERFGLYDLACFQTRVASLEWSADLDRWLVNTDRGDRMRARFVIVATGPASRPKLANIPGMETFRGHTFHTSRWDYDYTGGDHAGNLSRLADKRVAIIGTGASAIQCVPHLGAAARELYVFQRTPSSVDERGNRPTDPAWASSLSPGWQRRRRENFNAIVIGLPFEEDLVNDGWTAIFRDLQTMAPLAADADDGEGTGHTVEETALLAEIADARKMDQVRARVDRYIDDPATAEALKPWYRQFCKRPTFNDDYLPTFNRPNVTLVDTSPTRGVERITPDGVVADGVEYAVDCIIYATGFEIGTRLDRRIDFDILGEGGRSIFDHWSEGIRTLHGHSSRGFPNWFFIGIGQNGLSVNMTSMFDDQARHVAYLISEVKARGAITVQPTAAGEEAWVAEIRKWAMTANDFTESCTPGYYNSEGTFGSAVGTLAGEAYAPGANAFNALLARWRDDGDLAGLELAAGEGPGTG
ncbi:MAG: flavin-containing monooxygenase [Acidimicrobiales bacterium]